MREEGGTGVDELIESLKGWIKAGVMLVIGLLIAVVALRLTFALVGILVPALFVGGAIYLGYRWWRAKLAPPQDDEFDLDLKPERRRRW
jgi:hypothetical protein